MLKMLKKLMLINVKFQISILDFNFFHMDPPLFLIIAKFEEILSTKKWLKLCKSGKNFADFTIFPFVTSQTPGNRKRQFLGIRKLF